MKRFFLIFCLLGILGSSIFSQNAKAQNLIDNTFRTCDSIHLYNLPWFTNFDETDYTGISDMNRFPECWYRESTDPSSFVFVSEANYYSAPYSLDFNTISDYIVNTATLPPLGNDINVNELILSFYVYRTSIYGVLEIYALDNPTNPQHTDFLRAVSSSNINTWEHITINLNNYTGNGKYISLQFYSYDPSTCKIDNLTLERIPSCTQPLHVNASNIHATSADISWTDMTEANQWTVEYGPAGFAIGTGTTITDTTNPITINGLQNDFTYDVYVKTICDDGESEYSEAATFTTLVCDTADQCGYTFVLHADLGYGWTGNKIHVYSNDQLINTVKPAVGPSTDSVVVGFCDLSQISLRWEMGDYAENARFEILNPSGQEIYACANGSTLPVDEAFFSFTSHCNSSECLYPTDLITTGISDHSVTLDWNERNGASSWTIEYGPAGFIPGDGSGNTIENITTKPYEVTDLSSATNYDFYVFSNCNSYSQSPHSPVLNATTDCSIMELPYNEDFESYASTNYNQEGIVPICWTSITRSENYPAPHITSTASEYCYPHSGTQALTFTMGSIGDDAYTVLPKFSTALNKTSLSFWYKYENEEEGTLSVGYATSSTDMSTFVSLEDVPATENMSQYTLDYIALPNIPADAYIVIHWKYANHYSYFSCGVDDVNVSEADSTFCYIPNNITADNITNRTADLSWYVANNNNVNLQWRAENGNWTSVNNIAGFSYSLSNLESETTYEVILQAVCASGNSDWTEIYSFTTPAEICNKPTDLTISNISAHTAMASWTAGGSESSWKVGYKLQNDTIWHDYVKTVNIFSFDNLEESSTYDFRVQALCEESESEYATISFTTLEDVSIDPIDFNNCVSIQPNPANNYIDLTIQNKHEVKEAAIFNAFGQLVQTLQINNTHTRIDVSNLASGMYFIRLDNDNAIAIKKFIKK